MTLLGTHYLGLDLPHPIVPGASPLADDIDEVLRLEDAGAGAIVMRSIFQEQLEREQLAAHRHLDAHVDAEAAAIFPDTDVFALGLDAYLEQVRRIRERTSLAVIGSLNGTTPAGWTRYAREIEGAGADALELNLYALPSDPEDPAATVEERQLATVWNVTRSVSIPVAVKLSPYYSSLPHFIHALKRSGARAAVLFNRLYQADIDPLRLEAVRQLRLSTPEELLLRLRWLAIVSPRAEIDLAASGGVHSTMDVVKAIMAGAQIVEVVSTLLQRGPHQLRELIDGLARFLADEEYYSVAAMRGNMNRSRSPDPSAYERSDYIKLLGSWHGAARR